MGSEEKESDADEEGTESGLFVIMRQLEEQPVKVHPKVSTAVKSKLPLATPGPCLSCL